MIPESFKYSKDNILYLNPNIGQLIRLCFCEVFETTSFLRF